MVTRAVSIHSGFGADGDLTRVSSCSEYVGIRIILTQKHISDTMKIISDSTCTTNTVKQYLQGTIPEDRGGDGPDVLCEVDEGPFGLRKSSY
jgi:hypothetical protein